jgi:hypothetical protein
MTTNYFTEYGGSKQDLDDLFEPGPPGSGVVTGFKLEDGTDLGDRYQPVANGSAIAFNTGFVALTGADLTAIFAAAGSTGGGGGELPADAVWCCQCYPTFGEDSNYVGVVLANAFGSITGVAYGRAGLNMLLYNGPDVSTDIGDFTNLNPIFGTRNIYVRLMEGFGTPSGPWTTLVGQSPGSWFYTVDNDPFGMIGIGGNVQCTVEIWRDPPFNDPTILNAGGNRQTIQEGCFLTGNNQGSGGCYGFKNYEYLGSMYPVPPGIDRFYYDDTIKKTYVGSGYSAGYTPILIQCTTTGIVYEILPNETGIGGYGAGYLINGDPFGLKNLQNGQGWNFNFYRWAADGHTP